MRPRCMVAEPAVEVRPCGRLRGGSQTPRRIFSQLAIGQSQSQISTDQNVMRQKRKYLIAFSDRGRLLLVKGTLFKSMIAGSGDVLHHHCIGYEIWSYHSILYCN